MKQKITKTFDPKPRMVPVASEPAYGLADDGRIVDAEKEFTDRYEKARDKRFGKERKELLQQHRAACLDREKQLQDARRKYNLHILETAVRVLERTGLQMMYCTDIGRLEYRRPQIADAFERVLERLKVSTGTYMSFKAFAEEILPGYATRPGGNDDLALLEQILAQQTQSSEAQTLEKTNSGGAESAPDLKLG